MNRRVVLLRVGIDSGCGGIQGPLFADGTFEFMCIPDSQRVSVHTYGNMTGRDGRCLVEYFPASRRERMTVQHVHVDPEFDTCTYGDPTPPKRSLRKLQPGDYLAFYSGLQGWSKESGWDHSEPPGLYLVGYFKVTSAGLAKDFDESTIRRDFGLNFHVRYPSVFAQQRLDLVLVKGGPQSRLLRTAYRISETGRDRSGKPLKVLSQAMQQVFGSFDGHIAIQRSPPRWVDSKFVPKAIDFLQGLR